MHFKRSILVTLITLTAVACAPVERQPADIKPETIEVQDKELSWGDLITLVDKLPALRDSIYASIDSTADDRERATTTFMIASEYSKAMALLPYAIQIQAHGRKQSLDSARTEIERDLEALEREVEIRRFNRGWGGRESRIEQSVVQRSHLENLISYWVTKIYEHNDTKREYWYSQWWKD